VRGGAKREEGSGVASQPNESPGRSQVSEREGVGGFRGPRHIGLHAPTVDRGDIVHCIIESNPSRASQ
jgi:hypothetical protein